MNIQSEAKPHGLICPFTMAVIIRESPRLLLRQDEKALWQSRKVPLSASGKKKKFFGVVGGVGGGVRGERESKRMRKLALASHKRNT